MEGSDPPLKGGWQDLFRMNPVAALLSRTRIYPARRLFHALSSAGSEPFHALSSAGSGRPCHYPTPIQQAPGLAVTVVPSRRYMVRLKPVRVIAPAATS